MRVAFIDSCKTSLVLYSKSIESETGAKVDCFSDPLSFLATRVKRYDIVISDFYFKGANLLFYWKYLDEARLIILSSDHIDIELNCLSVLKKNCIHSKRNIVSIFKMIAPSLQLVRPKLD